MANEFINKLETNEHILFHGISNISKTSKQYARLLLIFLVLMLFWILTILGIKSEGIFSFEIMLIFIGLCILTFCFIYAFFYNTVLKYKNKNNEYFVTNKRIAVYSLNSGFKIKNISDIEQIGILREKNNYGDVIFSFCSNNLLEQMRSVMSFEGVENPRKIVALICEINNKVHIYDDRPTIFGKKLKSSNNYF